MLPNIKTIFCLWTLGKRGWYIWCSTVSYPMTRKFCFPLCWIAYWLFYQIVKRILTSFNCFSEYIFNYSHDLYYRTILLVILISDKGSLPASLYYPLLLSNGLELMPVVWLILSLIDPYIWASAWDFPAKPQISLRIRAVWSEPLLVAWLLYDC